MGDGSGVKGGVRFSNLIISLTRTLFLVLVI